VPSPGPTTLPRSMRYSPLESKWTFLLPLALVGTALATGAGLWFQRTEYFWRNPIADARFSESHRLRRSGNRLPPCLATVNSWRFCPTATDNQDVWVTQLGSGQFHNLTQAPRRSFVNPSIRTLGFSPDGSFVTFWVRNGPER